VLVVGSTVAVGVAVVIGYTALLTSTSGITERTTKLDTGSNILNIVPDTASAAKFCSFKKCSSTTETITALFSCLDGATMYRATEARMALRKLTFSAACTPLHGNNRLSRRHGGNDYSPILLSSLLATVMLHLNGRVSCMHQLYIVPGGNCGWLVFIGRSRERRKDIVGFRRSMQQRERAYTRSRYSSCLLVISGA
jgi:hypothetical protein